MSLTVWYLSLGREALLIATQSKKEAAAAMGMSLYSFNQYAMETGNTNDLTTALEQPGVMFTHQLNAHEREWREIRRRDRD